MFYCNLILAKLLYYLGHHSVFYINISYFANSHAKFSPISYFADISFHKAPFFVLSYFSELFCIVRYYYIFYRVISKFVGSSHILQNNISIFQSHDDDNGRMYLITAATMVSHAHPVMIQRSWVQTQIGLNLF